MEHLIPITDDLYDVAARLKSVNGNYRLYYNAKSCKYEVYNADVQGISLAFAVPYDELDCRTVEYARYTSVASAKQLFAEIERHNKNLTDY